MPEMHDQANSYSPGWHETSALMYDACVISDGSGKSSLAMSFFEGQSLPHDVDVPGVIEERVVTPLWEDEESSACVSNYDVVVIDTAENDHLENIVKRCDVLMCVYDMSDASCINRVHSWWLPRLRAIIPPRMPIIVVGTKLNQFLAVNGMSEDSSESEINVLMEKHIEELEPHMAKYGADAMSFCECIDKERNVQNAFLLCARSAVFPVKPLYDAVSHEMSPKCTSAITRIFFLANSDSSGILSSTELQEYQRKVYDEQLSIPQVEDIFKIVQENTANGTAGQEGLTLEGFLFLNKYLIQRNKAETVWMALWAHEYDCDLRINVPTCKLPHIKAGERVVPQPQVERLLSDLFEKFQSQNGKVNNAGIDLMMASMPTKLFVMKPDSHMDKDHFINCMYALCALNPALFLETIASVSNSKETASLDCVRIIRDQSSTRPFLMAGILDPSCQIQPSRWIRSASDVVLDWGEGEGIAAFASPKTQSGSTVLVMICTIPSAHFSVLLNCVMIAGDCREMVSQTSMKAFQACFDAIPERTRTVVAINVTGDNFTKVQNSERAPVDWADQLCTASNVPMVYLSDDFNASNFQDSEGIIQAFSQANPLRRKFLPRDFLFVVTPIVAIAALAWMFVRRR